MINFETCAVHPMYDEQTNERKWILTKAETEDSPPFGFQKQINGWYQ